MRPFLTVLALLCPGIVCGAHDTAPEDLKAITSVMVMGQAYCYHRNKTGSNPSWDDITPIPCLITALPNIKHLNLWGSQLTSIPPEIWTLTNLETLSLSHNNFKEWIPSEIQNFTRLVSFNAYSAESDKNHLCALKLPASITHLNGLTTSIVNETVTIAIQEYTIKSTFEEDRFVDLSLEHQYRVLVKFLNLAIHQAVVFSCEDHITLAATPGKGQRRAFSLQNPGGAPVPEYLISLVRQLQDYQNHLCVDEQLPGKSQEDLERYVLHTRNQPKNARGALREPGRPQA